jgi:hypothetical protein
VPSVCRVSKEGAAASDELSSCCKITLNCLASLLLVVQRLDKWAYWSSKGGTKLYTQMDAAIQFTISELGFGKTMWRATLIACIAHEDSCDEDHHHCWNQLLSAPALLEVPLRVARVSRVNTLRLE